MICNKCGRKMVKPSDGVLTYLPNGLDDYDDLKIECAIHEHRDHATIPLTQLVNLKGTLQIIDWMRTGRVELQAGFNLLRRLHDDQYDTDLGLLQELKVKVDKADNGWKERLETINEIVEEDL